MKIGLIGENGKFAAHGPGNADWQIYNFSISTRYASFVQIPHSAFATPARYVMELLLRLCAEEERECASPKLVFNPLFEADRYVLMFVLEKQNKRGMGETPVVYCDRNEIPIAYYFPASIGSGEARYLSLLSAVNAGLDREWLEAAFLRGAEIVRIPAIGQKTSLLNGFYGKPYFDIYEWVTRNAIGVLAKVRPESGGGQEARLKCRDDVPFAAIMPHHAGDVLFFGLAAAHAGTHVKKVVVNAAYANILDRLETGLEVEALAVQPMNRGGEIIPEWEYFALVREKLPPGRFYYYCRPTRDYDVCRFHLIDQFAFALADTYDPQGVTRTASRPAPELFRPTIAVRPLRVLLHLDSGWPLKIYPEEFQHQLIAMLLSKGYEVTVLDGKFPVRCASERFESLDHFMALLGRHHILVGMDSFPCHYAAHVFGLPTICLFASTRPENSDAPPSRQYRYLENGLDCRPCRAISRCPLNGQSVCNNFVTPDSVSQEISHMLEMLYPMPSELHS
jgi:hypothetical protein